MRGFVGTILGWAFTVVFWPVVLAVDLLTFKGLRRGDLLVHLIRFWGRTTLKLCGAPLRFTNAFPLDSRAPRVVICNHQSALDIVWGAAICAPAPLAIGKREVAYIPVLNLIWWALDFIRIDRKNTASAIAALQGVAEKIRRQSRTLYVAPEGTRTPDGEMMPFKKGAFHIAVRGGIPIYPLVVAGAFEALPKSRLIARPGEIVMKFLEPVPTEGLGPEDIDRLVEEVRGRMVAEYQTLRSLPRH